MNDQPLHMWSHITPSPMGISSNAHGTCGAHIGRFVSKVEDVTCADCLAIINAKEAPVKS